MDYRETLRILKEALLRNDGLVRQLILDAIEEIQEEMEVLAS